jgi:tripartite-type tricarboxylate transporter receptor subunit TctC
MKPITKNIRQHHMWLRSVALTVVCALAGVVNVTEAQPYPSKLVRMVTGSAAGGGSDIAARQIAPKLAEAFGQQVLVDNRPGLAGMLANEMVAKALAAPAVAGAQAQPTSTGSGQAASTSSGQAYPQRPVRIIVNVSAGGGVDILARITGAHMSAAWGHPFVIDNRTGAGGAIGTELAAKPTPDGYTLLVSSNTFITTAAIRPQGYDPVRDFQAVTQLTSNPYIVCVTPALVVNSVKDLIALAKTKPGGLSYGSAGAGSILHLSAALLVAMAGVPMVHVPYKGVAEVYPAVASGQIHWVNGSPISALPLIKAGRLKGIAVTGAKRARAQPDLPTVAESGVPGYEVIAWFGMLAPAKTPMTIVNKLRAEAKRALQAPEVVRRMDVEGTDIIGSTPREFAAEVKAEFEKWRGVVKKAGISEQG